MAVGTTPRRSPRAPIVAEGAVALAKRHRANVEARLVGDILHSLFPVSGEERPPPEPGSIRLDHELFALLWKRLVSKRKARKFGVSRDEVWARLAHGHLDLVEVLEDESDGSEREPPPRSQRRGAAAAPASGKPARPATRPAGARAKPSR